MRHDYFERRREILPKFQRRMQDPKRFNKLPDQWLLYLTHHEILEFFTIKVTKAYHSGGLLNPEDAKSFWKAAKESQPDLRIVHPRYFHWIEGER